MMAHSQHERDREAYHLYETTLEACFSKEPGEGGLTWEQTPDQLMAAMKTAEQEARKAYLATMAENHKAALDSLRSGQPVPTMTVEQEEGLAREQGQLEGRVDPEQKQVDRKQVLKLEQELVGLRAERDLLKKNIDQLQREFPDGYDLEALKTAAEDSDSKKRYITAVELSRYEARYEALNEQILTKTEAYLEHLQEQVESAIENITYDVFRHCSRTYSQLIEMRDRLTEQLDEFEARKKDEDFNPDEFLDNECFSDARSVLLDANMLLKNEAALDKAAMATAYGRGFDMRQVMKSKVTTTSYVDANGLEQVEFSCQMHNGNRGGWATDNLTLLNRDLDATVAMMNGRSVGAPESLSAMQGEAPKWLIYAACCPLTMPLVAAGGLLYGVSKGLRAVGRMTGLSALCSGVKRLCSSRTGSAYEAVEEELTSSAKATDVVASPPGSGVGADGSARDADRRVPEEAHGVGGGTATPKVEDTSSPRAKLKRSVADVREKVLSGALEFVLVKRAGRRVVMAKDEKAPRGRQLSATEHYLYLSTRLKRSESNPMFSSDWTALRRATRNARKAAMGALDPSASAKGSAHAGVGMQRDDDSTPVLA